MSSFKFTVAFQLLSIGVVVTIALLSEDYVEVRHKGRWLFYLAMAGGLISLFSLITSCLTEHGYKKDIQGLRERDNEVEARAAGASQAAAQAMSLEGTSPATFVSFQPIMPPEEFDAIVAEKELEMRAIRGT